MRLPLLFLFLLALLPAARGQVYTMDNTPVSTCSGTFTDIGGLGGSYGNNQNIAKTFTSQNGQRLQFDFSSGFITESGYDALYIYDGPDMNAPMLAALSGNHGTGAGTFTSTGTTMTFRFVSDNTEQYAGWSAAISCAGPVPTGYTLSTGPAITTCNAFLTDEGGYTGNYFTPNSNAVRTFCSANGQHLKADMVRNGLLLHFGDTLYVYDGNSTTANMLGAYTANSVFEPLTSTGTCLTFRFKTDAGAGTRGFAVLLSCTATPPSASPSFNMSTGIRLVCGGGFYDQAGAGNYPHNQDLQQTFAAPGNQRLSVSFASFVLETGFDFLRIYDGPSADAPLIGSYTGGGSPGVITSTGSALTFRFTSDQAETRSGWAATFSCSGTALAQYPMTPGTVTACQGVAYDAGGVTGNYPNNANTTQTFCSGTSDKLKFSFNNQAFRLLAGDTLKIYDGNSTAGAPIGYYTSGSTVEEFTSSGTCVTMQFKSNAVSIDQGWQALFSCTTAAITSQSYAMSSGTRFVGCGSTVKDPGGDFNYANGLYTTQTFTSYTGERLTATFNSFVTETNSDWLYIYDGPSDAYPLIGAYTGGGPPQAITSSGRSLTFRFTSDGSETRSGFHASLTCAGPVLTPYVMSSGTVNACSGVFYDAGGPTASYPDNENRVQTFCAPTGQNLLFTFNNQAFTLERGDSLFVYDGSGTSASPIGVYTYASYVEAFQSSGTCITFRFKSNGLATERGWQAFFACTTQPPATQSISISSGERWLCNAYLRDNGGTATYSNGVNTQQTYHSKNGGRLRATFNSFVTETNSDWLYVYDGPTTAYPLIGAYTGGTNPGAIQSSGTSLTFRFTTDGSETRSGYEAYLECFDAPLPVYTFNTPTVVSCSGVVYDPGGPAAGYPAGQDKVQTFCSGSGQHLGLRFNNLATSLGNGDTLYVYDGNGTGSPLRAKYHEGTTNLYTTYSTGTCLTLRLLSNPSGSHAGFQGFISCVDAEPLPRQFPMTASTIWTCGGRFTDPGGDSPYMAGQNVVQTFRSEGGYKLSFRFSSMSTESCCDRLTVYDGPSTASPTLGTWSGTNSPGIITSSGTALTFRWQSDGAQNFSGWQADIACVADVPLAGQPAGGPYCAGSTLSIPYTSPAVQAGNVYTVQLSDANGLFSSPTAIGTLSSESTFGSIQATLPVSLPAGTNYRVRVLSSLPAMTGTISQFTLAVLPAPAQPGSVTGPIGVCANATGMQFSIAAAANASGYVWSVPAGAVITAGQGTTRITVDFGTQSGNVTVFSTNNCGNSTERTFAVAITPPLAPVVNITSNAPGNQFCPGTQVVFTADGNGSGSYQWRRNGADIPGATGVSLVATPQHNDRYQAVFTPQGCFSPASAESNTITVQAAAAVRPQVSIDGPAAVSLCQGATLELTLTASGQGTAPTYRWYKNNTLVATQSNPTLQTSAVANGDRFFAILQSSSACASPTSDTSQTVTVTVTPSVVPAVTLSSPTAGQLCAGADVVLRARFTHGGASPNFDWTINGNPLSRSDSVITVPATAPTLTAQVTLLSNAACASPGQATSQVLTINASPLVTVAPTVAGPAGALCQGSEFVMTASPNPAVTGQTFQWQKNGLDIAGATSATYRTSSVQNGDRFTVLVTTPGACVTNPSSTSAPYVAQVQATVAPSVAVRSLSGSNALCAGQDLQLEAEALQGGGPSPAFQWFRNGVAVPGATSRLYTSTTAADQDAFSVVMTSSLACASPAADTSATLSVRVYDPAVRFTQMADTLVATATGATAYQWYWNGQPIAGATGPRYRPTITGLYHVVALTPLAGCTAEAPPILVVVTSARPNLATSLRLYPNPARNTLYLEGLKEAPLAVRCVSASGAAIPLTVRPEGAAWKLDVAGLARGLYTLEVRRAEGLVHLKWVRE